MQASRDPKTRQKTRNGSVAGQTISRPSAKSRETRERVIRGAIAALEEFGIGDATTRRIAAAAEVQLATLHYHFDSKETLLLAVLEMMNADLSRAAIAGLAPHASIEQRVEDLVHALWRHAKETHQTQIAQIELTLYALRTKGSDWIATRQYESYSVIYAQHLLGAIDRPPEKATAIATALGRFVLCGIDGLILQSFSLQNDSAEKENLQALIDASKYRARTMLAEIDR